MPSSMDLAWIVIIAGAAWVAFTLWSAFIGAGFEPTSQKKVKRMLEMASVGPADVVYDLGSGDGRIAIESARRFGARAVGIEADPIRVAWSRMMARRFGVSRRVKIVWGNFFHEPLSEASVVTLFLTTGTNRRLRTKLAEELRPGTRVVSYVWKIDGWEPKEFDSKLELYLYVR